MEVMNANQWNNNEADDNGVEEISLQRKSVVQHSSSSSASSSADMEAKGKNLTKKFFTM
jgi:hypothetical protein